MTARERTWQDLMHAMSAEQRDEFRLQILRGDFGGLAEPMSPAPHLLSYVDRLDAAALDRSVQTSGLVDARRVLARLQRP